VTVALGFLALSACGWVVYRLGVAWFGRAAGALAALILVTRVPLLSYGVRAYVDIPYLLLVLCALLVETRRRRAGAPVLVLLALAGLLRPEAWVFSGLYWIYFVRLTPRTACAWVRVRTHARSKPSGDKPSQPEVEPGASSLAQDSAANRRFTRRQIVGLTLLAGAAPLIWVASDWLITGHPLLSNSGPQLLPAVFSHSQQDCLRSLDALALLETEILLPGHGDVWRGPIRTATDAATELAR